MELIDRHENQQATSSTLNDFAKCTTIYKTIFDTFVSLSTIDCDAIGRMYVDRASETRDRCMKIVVFICCLFVNGSI